MMIRCQRSLLTNHYGLENPDGNFVYRSLRLRGQETSGSKKFYKMPTFRLAFRLALPPSKTLQTSLYHR